MHWKNKKIAVKLSAGIFLIVYIRNINCRIQLTCRCLSWIPKVAGGAGGGAMGGMAPPRWSPRPNSRKARSCCNRQK